MLMSRDDKIREIIVTFARASGRMNILPGDTNPRDTYQWRYVAKFVDNMDGSGVSLSTMKKMVCFIVEHIREHKSLWTKGLWALTRGDIVDISCKRMAEYERNIEHELDLVRRGRDFVKSQAYPLHHRRGNDAYPNIVIWYNTNKISTPFIASSRLCHKAILGLADDERDVLPMNSIQIWRILLSTDDAKKACIRILLGNDMFCLR